MGAMGRRKQDATCWCASLSLHFALLPTFAGATSFSARHRCLERAAIPADGDVEEVRGHGERVENGRSGWEGMRGDTDASSLAPLLSISKLHPSRRASGLVVMGFQGQQGKQSSAPAARRMERERAEEVGDNVLASSLASLLSNSVLRPGDKLKSLSPLSFKVCERDNEEEPGARRRRASQGVLERAAGHIGVASRTSAPRLCHPTLHKLLFS